MPTQPVPHRTSCASSALLALLVAGVAFGCSAPKTEAYRAGTSPNPVRLATTDRVRITLDPIVEPMRGKALFATEPLRKGILPVHVQIDHVGAGSSVLIQQSDFALLAGDGSAIQTTGDGGVDFRNKTAEGVGTVGVVLLSPALMFSAGPQVARALAVKHNFAEKEFPLRTSLSPGRSAAGFVYFRVPDRQPPSHAVIRLAVRNLDGGDLQTIELPLDR